MYAVIKTGGKQYKVAANDVIKVEKLPGKAGDSIVLDQVLMMGDDKASKVGTPILASTSVTAEILEQKKDDKIIVFKKNRRKNYRRTKGHRQELTVLRIISIGGTKAPAKQEAKKETPKAPVKKAPAAKTEAKETKAKTGKKAPIKKPAAPKTKAAPKKALPKKVAKKKTAAKGKEKS